MSAAEKKCPVDHKLLAEQQKGQGIAREENGAGVIAAKPGTHPPETAGKCPVDHESLAKDKQQAAQKCPVDHANMNGSQKSQGKCPVDHSSMSALPGGLKENGKPPKAVCPFGFGSEESGGPTLTSLHCPKCKGLFFDCVKSNCGHDFCRDCIIISKECLACGDEVKEVKPDSKVQGLVDTFVATHSSDPKFLEDKAAAGSTKDAEEIKAEFLLEIALQSLAGGNFKAAFMRLQLCKDQLLNISQGGQPKAETAVQLGAVCGSQGDCQARMGNAEQASSSYEESISYLESCPTKSLEVEKALTVTQNKLGDLLYRTGNLERARDQYQKALTARQGIAAASEGDEKWVAELDVAFSLAKLADIEQVLQQSARANELLQKAKGIAAQLEQQKDKLDAPAKKRLDAVHAFLAR